MSDFLSANLAGRVLFAIPKKGTAPSPRFFLLEVVEAGES